MMAPCKEAEQLTVEFKALARSMRQREAEAQSDRIDAWLARVGKDCLGHALNLLDIYDAREVVHAGRSIFVSINGDLVLANNDQSVKILGDVYGGVITGKIDQQTIGQLQNNVETKGKIDQEGSDLFKGAFGQLADVGDESERVFIGKRLAELQAEMAKDEPKKTIVDSVLGGLQAFAKAVPAIKTITTWVAGILA